MERNIFFKSPEHKERLITTIRQIGKVWEENRQIDPEYASALYILTSDLTTWNKASGYVDRDGIDFEAMLEEVDFSGGYAVLINLAWNLFNDYQKIDVLDLLRLDEGNFQVALGALKLRRYRTYVNDLEKNR